MDSSSSHTVHRSIVLVDVEGFSRRERTDGHQVVIRDALYASVRRAFDAAGLAWDHCHVEDRGDGILLLVPPNVPKTVLAGTLPRHLAAAVEQHNAAHPASVAFRLRMALHAGEIRRDDHGVAGQAVILPFRLIDSPALRDALRRSDAMIALVVSEWFFEEVVRHHPPACPDHFSEVSVEVKETRVAAWIRLLTGDGGTSRPAGPGPARPPARELPQPVPGFVGRSGELHRLDRLLCENAPSLPVAALHGMPGTGKTALAAYWASSVADSFPDGQLYVDLHGHSPRAALHPAQVLGRLLRSLGIPDQHVPLQQDERSALYRSLLADRRVLILLDNAADPGQVRPLLPGVTRSMVLITSRSRLTGLAVRDGVHRIELDEMPESEAVGLLSRTVESADRVVTPEDLRRLARLCGCLPLALLIAGEFVAGRAETPLADLVTELENEHDLIGRLSADEDEASAIRATFSWSYRALPDDAARFFRLLGLHPGPDLGLPAMAALAGTTLAEARRLVAALVSLHLVHQQGHLRYRMHDLLRRYAAELAAEDPSSVRDRAITRLLDWYLRTASAADHAKTPRGFGGPQAGDVKDCEPGFTSHREALEWYEAESANIFALTDLAGKTGRDNIAWRLPVALSGFFLLRKPWREWTAANEIGLASARRSGDRCGEGWTLAYLGLAHREMRNSATAERYARLAITAFTDTHDRVGQAVARTVSGLVYRDQRDHDQAMDQLEQALQLFREQGHPWGEGICLTALGIVLRDMRRQHTALEHCRWATEVFRAMGDRWGEAMALSISAQISRDLGNLAEAIGICDLALPIHDEIGDRHTEAVLRNILGTALLRTGQSGPAIEQARQALKIFREIGDRHGEAVALNNLAIALSKTDRSAEAHWCWHTALGLLEQISSPRAAAVSLRLRTVTHPPRTEKPTPADTGRPVVFVSYAHESDEHKKDVLKFTDLLASCGIEPRLDQFDLGQRRDWQLWATSQILVADFVLVIASPACRKVGDGLGEPSTNLGLKAEMRLLRELYQAENELWTRKLLPVVLPGRSVEEIPLFLQPRSADHFIVTAFTPEGAEGLLRTVHSRPPITIPTVGSAPPELLA